MKNLLIVSFSERLFLYPATTRITRQKAVRHEPSLPRAILKSAFCPKYEIVWIKRLPSGSQI